jgi:shikimate dehydrogenase
MKKAFVVGHPIQHSRSPLIHHYWLKQYVLEGSYERIDIAPPDFENFLKTLKDQGFCGGNVTLPHKEAAFRFADQTTPRAQMMQAVNTLWFEGGTLWGDNTDSLGFMQHLHHSFPHWQQTTKTALVLGAGGAARGIIGGLLDHGLEQIFIANRTKSRAEALQSLDQQRLEVVDWEDIKTILPHCDLLINTTSLGMQSPGMKGQPPLEVRFDALSPKAIIADIVYVPLETPLLRQAREHGLNTLDGLGMLLHQAVPGFARWFGIEPEVTPELHRILEADIAGSAP